MYRKTFENLSGTEKGAIVLMFLPMEQFNKVLSLMSEEEVNILCTEVSKIGSVDKSLSDMVLKEFMYSVNNVEFVGNIHTIKNMIKKLPGEKQNDIMIKIDTDIWSRFSLLPKQKILRYISHELVEIAAIVMTKIDSSIATYIIESLKKEHAADLLFAISKVDQVDSKFIALVERAISENFDILLKESTKSSLIDIFNSLESESENAIIPLLSKYDKELIKFIKDNQFTFQDIENLSDIDRKTVVRNLDKELLTISLIPISDEKLNLYLAGMTQRSISILKEDIKLFSAETSESKIKSSQIEVARLVRYMIKEGTISPPIK